MKILQEIVDELTPKEYEIYQILNERRGELVAFDEIISKTTRNMTKNYLQVKIYRMREKGLKIERKNSRGYKLVV